MTDSLQELTDDQVAAIMNDKILISDATAMYRRNVKANMLPYTSQSIREFNKMVDRWGSEILTKRSGGTGYVNSSIIHRSWMAFFEGIQAQNFVHSVRTNRIEMMSRDQVKWWVDTITRSSIADLINNVGVLALQTAWGYVQQALRYELTRMKNEEVFSVSSSPNEWMSLLNEKMKLSRGDVDIFGINQSIYADANDRVTAVVSNIPRVRLNPASKLTPEKFAQQKYTALRLAEFFKSPTHGNITTYNLEANKAYNKIVDRFYEDVLRHIQTDIQGSDGIEMMNLYLQGIELTKNLETVKSNLPLMTSESFVKWANHLSTADVTTIVSDDGVLVLQAVWKNMTESIRWRMLELKRDHVFSSRPPTEWFETLKKIDGDVFKPFPIEANIVDDIRDKVVTITSNIPKPPPAM